MARGIRPLWVMIGAPCFAQQNPRACAAGDNRLHPKPQYYDELAEFAVTAARRYPSSIGFEVWNEPNYPKYWGGPPEPGDYAQMLKTVADALHSQVPGMTVVSAGLSPHADTDTGGSIGFRNFLIEMYERGAAQQADAIGIHPYPGVGPGQDYLGDVRVYLGKIQNVMDRYGDGRGRCGRPSSASRPPASGRSTRKPPGGRSASSWRCSRGSAGSSSRSSTASSRSRGCRAARAASASSART